MNVHFGTNGIRGKFGELTPELVLKLSRGIGKYFNSGKIGVARDARLTGECLRNAVHSGLMSVGCKVIDFGIISSPTAEFMVKKFGLDGLIIITASHNPPDWNALKVIDGKGISISRERGAEIEELMDSESNSWDNVGEVEEYSDAVDNHLEYMKKFLEIKKISKKKLKIVADFGNGTVATIIPQLFDDLGIDGVFLNSKIDGKFPGRPSEPTRENVGELIEKVKKKKADAGIAWDGDGDRVIFVDENGEYLFGDKVFGLCVLLKLKENKGNLITTVATSKLVEDIGAKNEVETIYTKVGAPYMSEEMAKGEAVIAGEEVGGVIWPEISLAKDGVFTAAKLCDALCSKKLSEWMKEIPKYYLVKTKIKVKDEEKKEKLEKVKNYAEGKNLKIITVDGVRVNFDDGWIIVRASGTEPYMRIFAEGKTKEKADGLLKEYKELVD